MNENRPGRRPPSGPHDDDGPPAHAVALVLGGIAIACVLSYLLIMKLVEMKRTENCLLAHRHNCGPAIEMPMRR